MLNINEEDLKKAIVEKAADEILKEDDDLSDMIRHEVKKRLDAIFEQRASAQIQAAIDDAIKQGFEREYQKVDSWGQAVGEKTSIKQQLDKMVGGYWNTPVDKSTGKPTEHGYSAITRAEFLMAKICAEDFSEAMKNSAVQITGALKDGLRNQMGQHMDKLLESLFRVRSLQDQGKVEKPY